MNILRSILISVVSSFFFILICEAGGKPPSKLLQAGIMTVSDMLLVNTSSGEQLQLTSGDFQISIFLNSEKMHVFLDYLKRDFIILLPQDDSGGSVNSEQNTVSSLITRQPFDISYEQTQSSKFGEVYTKKKTCNFVAGRTVLQGYVEVTGCDEEILHHLTVNLLVDCKLKANLETTFKEILFREQTRTPCRPKLLTRTP